MIAQPPQLLLKDNTPVLLWNGVEVKVPRLKHGVLFLMVNQIASQLTFCEYKIHLDYSRGRLVGVESVEGAEEHSRQLGGLDVDFGIEVGWDPVVVNRGDEGVAFFNTRMRNWLPSSDFTRPYLTERSVLMLINNVPILGLPDIVVNSDGAPKYIIELKTTNRPVNINYVNRREQFQAEVYYHMVNQLGFRVSGVAVVKVVRGLGIRVLDNLPGIVNAIEGNAERRLTKGLVVHVIKPRPIESVLKDVEYALQYWLGIRNASPSPGISRCRVCEHRRYCPFSLVKTP